MSSYRYTILKQYITGNGTEVYNTLHNNLINDTLHLPMSKQSLSLLMSKRRANKLLKEMDKQIAKDEPCEYVVRRVHVENDCLKIVPEPKSIFSIIKNIETFQD